MPAITNASPLVTFAENAVNAAPALLDTDVSVAVADSALDGARLVVQGLRAEDRISILGQGSGAGQIDVAGATVSFGGVAIGTVAGGAGTTFSVTFNAAATAEAVEALIERLAYANVSDSPSVGRALNLDLEDAAGVSLSAPLAPVFVRQADIQNAVTYVNVRPALADMDGDGDLDIVVGDDIGQLTIFRNDGGTFTPLPRAANPLVGVDVFYRSAPAFADFDGDGDLDLAVGSNIGKVYALRNDGRVFTGLGGTDNPFGGVDVGAEATPSFADIDGDGDADLVVGAANGMLRAWQNDGGTFVALDGAANPFDGIDVGRTSAPSFIDMDRDGDPDLVVGDAVGDLYTWRNDGGSFTAQRLWDNPFGDVRTHSNAAPVFGDLNGDGRPDLVLGQYAYTLYTWRNVTSATSIQIAVTPEDDGAPVITSGTGVRYLESRRDAAYQATGSDPDGVITWSLSGPDAALFGIDSISGAVSFLTRPRVGAPADAGADNVYDITVTATENVFGATSQDVAIEVISREAPARLTGFASAVTFAENAVNAAPALLDAEVSFTAPEMGFDGAYLAARNLLAEDRISILAEGDGAGQIGVAGNTVRFGGIAFGTFNGGVGGAFTVTFDAAATAPAVEALIERLAYANVSGTPTATRTLSLDVVDRAGSRLNSPLAPVFTELTGSANPLSGLAAGTAAKPVLFDFNRDGYPDILAGMPDGVLGVSLNNRGVFGELSGWFADVGWGVAPTAADFDQDGDIDLVLGSFDGKLAAWRSGLHPAGYPILERLTGTDNPFNGIDVGDNSTPALADLDGDGDLDLVVGAMDGLLRTWRNDAGAFTALTSSANPFGGIDVGFASTPAFMDLDQDGDLDLVVGAYDGLLLAWRNDAGAFTALTGSSNPFAGIDLSYFYRSFRIQGESAPAFGDVDGDGDLDLVVGRGDGAFRVWRNDASGAPITVTVTAEDDGPPVITSGATARFIENRSGVVYTATGTDTDGPVTFSLSGADAAQFVIDAVTGAVSFVTPPDHELPGDADADNVYDITVVARDIHGITSGKAVAITVTDVVDPPRLAGVSAAVQFDEQAVNAAPALLDADVDFTALESGFAGGRLTVKGLLAEDRLSILAQGDAAGQIGVAGSTVSYGGVAIGSFAGGAGHTFVVSFNAAATAAAVDALIERLAYANVSNAPSTTRTLDLQVVDAAGARLGLPVMGAFERLPGDAAGFQGVTLASGSAPALGDLDGDGDRDFVVGGIDGTLRTLRNDGGSFVALTGAANPFNGIDVGVSSAPAFVDLDGDGDLDLVVGAESGLIQYWRNDAGSFAAQTGAANPFNAFTGLRSSPAFGDMDGDGDADLALGRSGGRSISVWRNDGGFFTELTAARMPGEVGSSPAPAWIDLNGDGQLDIVGGSAGGPLRAWLNDGDSFSAVPREILPFIGDSFEYFSKPTAADLDGDGVLDLLVAMENGALAVWRNVSPGVPITVTVAAQPDGPPVITSTAASFAETRIGVVYQALGSDSDGPITWSLSGRDAPLFTIDPATGAVSVVAPLDHEAPVDAGADNVYDITITAQDVHGSTTARDIALTVTNLLDTPPRLTGLSASVTFAENAVNARPALLDADVTFTAPESSFAGGRLTVRGLLAEDRLSILAEGNAPGQIGVTGTTVRYGGVVIGSVEGGAGSTFTVTLNAAATATAVDALIGRLAYANVSDTPTAMRSLTIDVVDAGGVRLNAPLSPAFALLERESLIESPNRIQQRAAAFADLDGDGDLDFVMGAWDGTLTTWRNNGIVFNLLDGARDPFASLDLGRYGTPASTDLDGDGDLDFVVGGADGTLRTLRNDGGTFTALAGTANPFSGIDVGYNSAPAFVDLDGDGDLDLVVGEQYGSFLTWRRDGASFVALTGAANPLAGLLTSSGASTPAFIDLDGDGDLDLVSGEGGGTLLAWRNQGGTFVRACRAPRTRSTGSISVSSARRASETSTGMATSTSSWATTTAVCGRGLTSRLARPSA